jgi:hypothetical protein
MAQFTIVTTPQNSGDGTPLATAFNYCNSNFSELYSRAQTAPPASLVGQIGDTAGMYAYDETYFYYCFADYDGTSIIWGQITQVGDISVSTISRGNSNVTIANLGGNVTTGVTGVANVVVVSNTGQFVTGIVSATGNIAAGGFILGNGSQLTGLPQSYANANVVSLLSTFGSNTISTTGAVTAGNVTGGNLLTNNIISATGNITTAGFFVGDFAGNIVGTLTNIPGPSGAVVFNNGSGNAAATAGLVFDNTGPNVLTVQGAYSATGEIIATGNITGGNLTGTLLTGTLSTAAQPNVTSVGTLSSLSVTANITGGNLNTGGQVSATGNIRTAGFFSAAQGINVGGDVTATSYTGTTASLTGNITGGNIRTGGQVSVTGNITGNYFVGNGSLLTGLVTNTIQNGNSNVLVGSSAGNVSINVRGIAPLAIFTPLGQTITGIISATGTVTAGNLVTGGTALVTGDFSGGNIATGGFVSASGNITGGNIITGNVSATSNVIVGSAGNTQIYMFGGNTHIDNNSTGNIALRANVAGNGVVTVMKVLGTGGIGVFGGIFNESANGISNIGTPTSTFNTIFAQATSAQYADLAEKYESDADYAPGTVVVFGGDKEITVTDQAGDERVAGVVSTEPAYLMNSAAAGLPVALRGKVPVRVTGSVTKGDSLITSTTTGAAQSVGRSREYAQAVFAKALETNTDTNEKVILAVIL